MAGTYEAVRQALEDTLPKLMEASVDTGVADATSTVNQLDDVAKSWPVNAFTNLIVEITEGTGLGDMRKITSNTATSITPTTAFTTAPDATSQYRIGFFGKMASDITAWGGTTLTGRDISLDLKALTDASITGILKSLGDIGAGDSLVTRITSLLTQLSEDIGDKTSPDAGSLNARMGEVSASPTAYTALARLKDLLTGIVLAAGTNVVGKVGIDQTTPGTTDRVTGNIDKWAGTTLTGRDISLDLKALTDASITGILKSLGDIGAGDSLVTRITSLLTQLSEDIGDKTSPDAGSLNARMGEVSASPTAYTALARLKDLLTGIVLAAGTNVVGKVGIDQTTPGTTDRVTGNIDKWAGTTLTGRDISLDLANLDIALSALRDAIRGVSSKDFTTLEADLEALNAKIPAITASGNLPISVAEASIQLPTDLQSQYKPLLDSTVVALGGAATYTGAAKDTSKYAKLTGSIFADQACTLYVDISPDGTNWDYSYSETVSASTGLIFSLEASLPYARLRIVNGGAAQATLRAYLYGRVI